MNELPKIRRDAWLADVESERRRAEQGPGIRWNDDQDALITEARSGDYKIPLRIVAQLILKHWNLKVSESAIRRRAAMLGLK